MGFVPQGLSGGNMVAFQIEAVVIGHFDLAGASSGYQMCAFGGGRLNDFAIAEMHDYLRRIGYAPDDLNKLNVVHITGTKGKGSTSAFTERILRTHLGGRIGMCHHRPGS